MCIRDRALLPVAKSVALLTNGAPLTADFPPEVTVHPQAGEAVLGETVVTGVQLSGGVQLPVSGVFVALGVAGSTALARNCLLYTSPRPLWLWRKRPAG